MFSCKMLILYCQDVMCHRVGEPISFYSYRPKEDNIDQFYLQYYYIVFLFLPVRVYERIPLAKNNIYE